MSNHDHGIALSHERQASRQTSRRSAILTAVVSATLLTASMNALSADDAAKDAAKLSEVVVTGTLIRGIAPVGAPVVSLGTEEIAETGLLDTASVLKTVPQVSFLGIAESTTGTTANGNGTNTTAGTGVNIRGLGQQATLTLVNGRRGAPGGQFGNYFEPSNIPTIALGGIEILTDGASAMYGSDAMAGVVNLTLRRNYSGAEARVSYGVADGYDTHDFSAVLGNTWSDGSFMIAAQRYYHSNLMSSDRSELFIADAPRVMAGNGALPRGFTNITPNANIRTGSGAGTVYYAAPYGATSFSQLTPNAQNVMGNWYNTTALPEQTRDAYVATFDQKLSDNISLYGQGYYSRRQWESFGGVSGSFLAVQSTLTVPSTNPYFIAGIPGVTTTETVLVSQFNNLGPLAYDGRETSWQGTLGATIGLWNDWRLDINVQRAANRVNRLRANTLNACGLTGGSAAACLTPASEVAGGTLAQTTTALAFNPFGANNAYVLSRIRVNDLQEGLYDSDIVTAKMDGALFSMPAGEARAAVGVEYRDDTEGQFNTTRSAAANSAQSIQIGTDKSMQVKSIFAEVVLPIVGESNAMPAVQRLDLSIAGRYTDYNILADTTTDPKFGVTWQPLDDLKVTASYGTSFRVNLASTDPNNAPLLRSRATTDYFGVGGSSNALQRGGGNPDLEPETSTTVTLGADWQVKWLPGLSVNLTYFDITYKGIIDTPGAALLNAITANSEAIYGAYITRRPSTLNPAASDAAFNALVASLQASPNYTGGPIPINLIVDARSQNAGVIETHGLDFKVAYDWGTDWGDMDAALLGEYFFNFKRSLTPAGVRVPRVGLIDFPQRYRVRAQYGWHRNGFGANLFGNYTPEYVNTYPTPVEKVNSYLTFDLGLSYDTADGPGSSLLQNITVSLNVQNLFDKKPPFVAEFSQNFDSSITSMVQRMTTIQVGKKF